MPESSLQDLRDDWKVGDEVLVEFQAHNGAATSVKAGRIVDKEASFATVKTEGGAKHKVQYKRLRRANPARPARPRPSEQLSLLRTVPPAFADLGTEPASIAPPIAVTPGQGAPAAPPAKEQLLVKLPPRSAKPAAPTTPTIAAPAPTTPTIAAPAIIETPEEVVEPRDAKAWLKMSKGMLEQLKSRRVVLQDEYEDAASLAARKLADLESVQADVETLQKMRDFVAKFRPRILPRFRLK